MERRYSRFGEGRTTLLRRESLEMPMSQIGQFLNNRSTLPISGIGPEADPAAHDSMGFDPALSWNAETVQLHPEEATGPSRGVAYTIVVARPS